MQQNKLLKFVPSKYERYSEIPQAIPTKFAWATLDEDKVTENHSPVLCRDFLNDTLVWRDPTEKGPVVQFLYGYYYKGFVHPDNTIFVLTIPTKLFPGFEYGKSILNKLENSLGVEKTRFLPTEIKNKIVSVGDSVWMKTTVHLSYYTALLRYMCAANEDTQTFEEIFKVCDKDDPVRYLSKYGVDKLGHAIVKLPFVSVRGAADPKYMHDMNGFVSALRNGNVYSPHLKGVL